MRARSQFHTELLLCPSAIAARRFVHSASEKLRIVERKVPAIFTPCSSTRRLPRSFRPARVALTSVSVALARHRCRSGLHLARAQRAVPGGVFGHPGKIAERSRYPRQDVDLTSGVSWARALNSAGGLSRGTGPERAAPCRRAATEMPRMACAGRPGALSLAVQAAQGGVGPERTASYDGKLRPRKLAAQALPDVPHDDRNVTHQVAELVDPVEEHHDAILVQPAQNAEQGVIGGRQGLLWCEHHDVDMRALERPPGDLVAPDKDRWPPACR